jgi:hypothetical protein
VSERPGRCSLHHHHCRNLGAPSLARTNANARQDFADLRRHRESNRASRRRRLSGRITGPSRQRFEPPRPAARSREEFATYCEGACLGVIQRMGEGQRAGREIPADPVPTRRPFAYPRPTAILRSTIALVSVRIPNRDGYSYARSRAAPRTTKRLVVAVATNGTRARRSVASTPADGIEDTRGTVQPGPGRGCAAGPRDAADPASART